MTQNISKVTRLNCGSVETWYDSSEKVWVTQSKDLAGNQIGEAEFSGTKLGAIHNHSGAVGDRTRVKPLTLDVVITFDGAGCNLSSKAMKCSFPIKRDRVAEELDNLAKEFLSLNEIVG